MEESVTWGVSLVLLAAAIPAILGFIGSALGMTTAGKAAAGVVAEKPDLFGKLLLMQALPGSQGIYGLVISFLVLQFSGVLGAAELPQITISTGVLYVLASLPLAISAIASAILQGKVAANGILSIAKDGTLVGKVLLFAAMIETWAIFGFLITIILLLSIV
ncbi:MAG: V-type ATP synthase subunit K [Candidatus Pacebacteria bacterium]|nr:V-type ATP synthase subunit K [Candidatus Paceibacterota bacterium]